MAATRDFEGFMDFGLGIDDVNGAVRGQAVTRDEIVETQGTGGQTVIFSLQSVESLDQLQKALGLSVDASAAYGLFGASDKFQLSENSNFQSYSLFLVVSMAVINSSKHLLNEKLRQDANGPATLLSNGNFDRFREEFGDLYIKGIETGGEFHGIIEIETQDESDKTSLSNQLTAGGVFGIGGAELATQFNTSFSHLTSNRALHVASFQRGGLGAGANPTLSPGDMLQKTQNLPADVAAHPVATRVFLQDYRSLDLPAPPNFIDIQLARDAVQSYFDQRAVLKSFLNDVVYIEKHTDAFESFDPAPVQAQVTKASAALTALAHDASQCQNNIHACQVNPDAFVPDRRVLPKRKAPPVTVPDFVHVDSGDPRIDNGLMRFAAPLANRVGLVLKTVLAPNTTPDDIDPVTGGEIISQVPVAGTQVERGSVVTVTID
jgi:hypothetical protein